MAKVPGPLPNCPNASVGPRNTSWEPGGDAGCCVASSKRIDADGRQTHCNVTCAMAECASAKGMVWRPENFTVHPYECCHGISPITVQVHLKSKGPKKLKTDDSGVLAETSPYSLLLLMMMMMPGGHHTADAYPKGLFVQLESLEYPHSEIQKWFQTICDSHSVNSSTMFVNDLVIQRIGYNGAPLSKQLALVEPYFHCFRTVFFGTAGLAPQPGDSYCEGIGNNASHRAAIVNDAVQGAKWVTQHIAESQLYNFGWYITHEAWVDYWGTGCDDGQGGAAAAAVVTGYAEMVGNITREMSALRPGDIMWSPSVREHHGYMGQWAAFEAGWSRFFRQVPLLNRLVIQDAIGKASTLSPNPLRQRASYSNYTVNYGVTCEDVAPYVHHLQAAATAAAAQDLHVGVNMELFVRTGLKRGNVPGDPYEIERREECYRQHGVAIGPCFEIRFWFRSLYEQVKYANATTALANVP
eukprot:COSAG05_NODE_823_length_7122_cov_13.546917_5_plen_469_part_00